MSQTPSSTSETAVATKAAPSRRAARQPRARPTSPRKPAATANAAKPAKRLDAKAKVRGQAKPEGKAAPAGRTATAKTAAAKAPPMAKADRMKLVRDSFTMPKSDVDLIAALKQRCLKLGHEAKKSELLRAGLHALAALQNAALLAAVSSVPRLKTGRPGQKKGK
ncbi:MAG: hypothetical protein JNJ89_03770 [Rubrivivax sp.]|nr:hypothetical protein [Rubrivivax sp.]